MLKKTQLVTAIGAVAGASFATAAIAADQTANPFQADDLETGSLSQNYNLGDDKDKEGSCGEGSCGEGDDKGDDKEGSCGEGSCGEGDDDGDDKEGSCGEGSCGEGDDKEGSCGEGSCGVA
ncbi:MAG: hypothetical protein WDZ60_05015 [Wenzhouxiangellaceae bacterium]